MQTDDAFRADVLAIGAASFHNIARDAVRRGDVNIAQKPRDEAVRELCAYVRNWVEGEITMVDDHRPEILEEARRCANEERPMIAIVLYATYFEHALNDLVLAGCARAKINHSIARRLVRAASVVDKTEELLSDIGLRLLPDSTMKAIRRIAECRNEFVHYKWIGRTDAEIDAHRIRIAETLRCAELAVTAFEAYEKMTLLEGFEKVLGPEKAESDGRPKGH